MSQSDSGKNFTDQAEQEEKLINEIKAELKNISKLSRDKQVEQTLELIARRISEKTITDEKKTYKDILKETKKEYEKPVEKYYEILGEWEEKEWWEELEKKDDNKERGAVDAFNSLGAQDFKLHCVQISQLLSEVWLNTERGNAFRKAVNKGLKVEKALEIIDGIEPIANYIEYQLDTSGYNGSMVPKEKLNEGLNFTWYLPYAPCPTSRSMEIDEVVEWVYKDIPEWIEKHKDNPFMEFPKPPNPYIPLATT